MVFSPGYSVGYPEQDPKLDPEKTVKEVVQEGVQSVLDLLKEYDEVNNAFADTDMLENPDKMESLINRQAELQDKLDACDAWNIDNKLERAMDALRCPPTIKRLPCCPAENAVGWLYAVCSSSSPTFFFSTSPPTTSTLKASTGSNSISSNIPAR